MGYKRAESATPNDGRLTRCPDSDDEDKEEPLEVDDGKRDKIFNKHFLRSITNQNWRKVALIQKMGEDRIIRAEIQTKVLKPSKFSDTF